MAQIDPEKVKRGILADVLKEMQRSKGDAFEKVASEAAAKAREGKGFISGAIAADSARRAVAKEYKIATEGTLGKRQAFFEGFLGRDLGNLFKNLGLEKMESVEKIKEAREKFGLDKKEKADRGGKGGGSLSKPLSIILRKVLEIEKIVKNIEKNLTKPTLKTGFSFDPRMAGGGRFKNADGKIVSSKQAIGAAGVVSSARTSALTAAIGADEDPLTNLRKEFDDKFKDFDTEEVQSDINNIQTMLLLLLAKMGIPTPNLPNKSTPEKPTPTPPGPKPGEPEKPKPDGKFKIPPGLKNAAKVVGKVSGLAAAGFAAYDAYQGFTNAEETLGLQKGAEATTGQKLASAAGGVVSGLTFGLVDAGNVGRFLSGTEENPTDANLEKYVVKKDASVNLSGLKPEMQKRLAGLAYEYNQKTGKKIQINSGYRDSKEQAELYAKYGPPRAAPPGRSRHESGLAVDINSDDANKATELGLMAKYGFTRPVPGETWHVEPVEVARKNPTPDNPYAPGAPVAVANAGGKPSSPDTGTKPPAALTAATPPAAVTSDASTTAPPAAAPPALAATSPAPSAAGKMTEEVVADADQSQFLLGAESGEYDIDKRVASDEAPSDVLGLPGSLMSSDTNVIDRGNESKPITTDPLAVTPPVAAKTVVPPKTITAATTDPLAIKSDGTAIDAQPMVGKTITSPDVPFTSSQLRSDTRNEGSAQVTVARSSSTTIGPKPNKNDQPVWLSSGMEPDWAKPKLNEVKVTGKRMPDISAVQNPLGDQIAQGSAQLESSKMIAQATPPAPVIINNNQGGGGSQQPIESPKTPLPKASSRSSESSFNRALAKDFSHPTAFTSVSTM